MVDEICFQSAIVSSFPLSILPSLPPSLSPSIPLSLFPAPVRRSDGSVQAVHLSQNELTVPFFLTQHPSVPASYLALPAQSSLFDTLHAQIRTVTETAVAADADASRFPQTWLFQHRWSKGKKKKDDDLGFTLVRPALSLLLSPRLDARVLKPSRAATARRPYRHHLVRHRRRAHIGRRRRGAGPPARLGGVSGQEARSQSFAEQEAQGQGRRGRA